MTERTTDWPSGRHAIRLWLVGAALLGLTVWTSLCPEVRSDDGAAVPTQPGQPTQGPGSSDYAHAGVKISKHDTGARQYWVFTPDSPMPERAPVVAFLHGWGSLEPDVYGAWIKHLVRRGNIVIFPRYQEGLASLPSEFSRHAAAAIEAAIGRLRAGDSVQPDLARFAIVGHSMGAILGANVAQHAARWNVPTPRALFLAEPAFEPILGTYEQIAPDTLLLVAVGAEVKRDSSARRILDGSTQVPSANKNYVAIPSDLHGNPPLVSDHFAPCSADTLGDAASKAPRSQWRGLTRDAIDYFGYWKLCDGLLDALRPVRFARASIHGRVERRHARERGPDSRH